ncbi:hypothetical protein H8957_016527, partial [Semnopithecus entellus]
PDHFQRGPDFFGIPWRAIIIVFLGISTLGIFLWKTSFGVSFLKIVLKLQNVHDRSTDVQRRAWRSNSRRQEGIKIALEDLFTSRSFMEARARAEVHKVTRKVNSHYQINGQRKTTEKGKLRMKEREPAEKEKQLSEAEENGKLVMKKIHTYKQMMPWPLDSLNIQFLMCWLFQMAPSARKALDNEVSLFVFLAFGHSLPGQNVDVFFSPQLFAQTLQWEMAERKAYKQHSPIPLGNCVVQKHLDAHPVVVRSSIFVIANRP